jgi:hypothetical protein
MLPPRSTRVITAVAGALVVGFATLHVWSYFSPFEDAYITFRYAMNFARGNGLVYNPGERVEGCSSLLWTVVLGGLAKLGWSPPMTATALSIIASLALVIVTYRVANAAIGADKPAALLAPLLVISSGTFAYYAGTGMETSFFALLVLGAVVLTARQGLASAALLGVVLALAAATRPEGAGYAIVLCLLCGMRQPRRALMMLSTFVPPFAAVMAFRRVYFGYFLPNTYYAKAEPSGGLLLAGLSYVEEYLTFWGGALFGAASIHCACATSGPTTWTRRFGEASAAVFVAACANAILVGGDPFAFHRFLLPALPSSAICVALFVGRAIDARSGRRYLLTLVAIAFAAWSVSAAYLPRTSLTARQLPSFASSVRGIALLDRQYFAVAEYLREHAPAGSVLAVNAAGIVPYVTELPTIDMLGLTDSHIAHRPIKLGRSVQGHEKYDPDYVLAREPDLILPGLPVLSPRRLHVATLASWFGQWTPFLHGDAQLLANPLLGSRYLLRVALVSEGRYLVIFVKRGSRAARSIPSAPG